jgi:hypothetical protein
MTSPSTTSPSKGSNTRLKATACHDQEDFNAWAEAVKQQMLAALQKRQGN